MVDKHVKRQFVAKATKDYNEAVWNAMNEYVQPHESGRPYVQSGLRKRTKEEAIQYVSNTGVGRRYQRANRRFPNALKRNTKKPTGMHLNSKIFK